MTQPDWDDGRLEAAFRAKFDRPAPQGLAKDVHVRIAGTSPARFAALRRSGPGSGLAAAAVVVVLVGTLTVGLGGFGRPGGSAPPADSATSAPGPSATPTEQAIPGSILGLPIIRVTDAIAIRDAGIDDREVAVHGWFADSGIPACPAPLINPINPLQVGCPDGFVWLMEQAESLIHRSGNETTMGGPSGPALNPELDGVDRSWEPTDSGVDANGDSTPVDVVFIGHFDDRRAALCPRAEIDACTDRFVVDSVARVHGVEPPLSVTGVAPGSTASTFADIEAIIATEAPQAPILSMVVVDPATDFVMIEPSLTYTGDGSLIRSTVWVVRVLETDRIATYIVHDGTDRIYEMSTDNRAVQVGGTIPGARATPSIGPWPPAGAQVVALTSPVGPNFPPVQVAVVDESGRLLRVTEKGSVHYSMAPFDGRFGAYAEPGTPGRVHLTWIGGICDSRITVTVAADLGSITFDMGPQPDCDTIGVGRELVLDFDGSVDVPSIKLRDAAETANPTTDARDYALDCGPLGPDTCEQKAAAVVAANATGSPTKRLESITFTDECGSYTVLFDDGTGMTASIDCILGGELRLERFLELERLRASLNDRRAAEGQASAPS